MRSRVPLLLSPLAIFCLFACSSMQVQTAKDPQSDLSSYKTYAWAPPQKDRPPSILDQTVKTTADKDLAAKGLKPSAPGATPDLVVSFYGASHDTMKYSPAPDYGYQWYPYYGTSYTTREGSLTLQMIDPKSNRIVWQGTATDVIGDAGASPEQATTAVNELFEKFPSG